jgi:hypothetical protein
MRPAWRDAATPRRSLALTAAAGSCVTWRPTGAETRDLAATYPVKAAELASLWDAAADRAAGLARQAASRAQAR